MISEKWLEFLRFLQQQSRVFAPEEQLLDSLNSKFAFLKSQFGNVNNGNDPRFLEWVEHEAFTSVLSDVLREQSFSQTELRQVFDLLLSVKLAQLALTVVTNHRQLLAEDEFALKRGMALQQLDENQQAEQAFATALSSNPDNHMALFYLGYSQLCVGEMEKATEYFKACVEKAPEFAGGYQNLAGCYYQESEFEQAAKCCEQAQRLDPTLGASYITAISSYLALGRLEAAGQWLQRARDNQVENIELSRLGGMWAHQSGKHQQAVSQLSRYLEITPHDFDVLAVRARALAADSQWQPLLADLKVLLELNPYDSWNLEQLFLASYHTGQWAQAEQAMFELCKQSDHYKITYRQQIDEVRKQQAIVLTSDD